MSVHAYTMRIMIKMAKLIKLSKSVSLQNITYFDSIVLVSFSSTYDDTVEILVFFATSTSAIGDKSSSF